MYLDRILYPVTALGPGSRIAVWTAGCRKRCRGCANPELWKQYPQQRIEPGELAKYVNALSDRWIDGITITGGEPFDQAREISQFLDALKIKTEVLAFSGYRLEELKKSRRRRALLDRIDVLIDGPYIEEQNDGIAPLRGSVNQNIHYLNRDVREEYEQYLRQGRRIENFIYDYKTFSVGIHNPSGLRL